MTSVLSPPSWAKFGFLTSDEIRALAVCKVTNPMTFDSLGHPSPDGLYDIRMGPTEHNAGLCRTCGADYNNCPGHAGRIELKVPVYHPLLLGNVQKLLSAKCFNCHRFRISEERSREFRVRMMLLEAGLLLEADALVETLARRERDDEDVAQQSSRRHRILKEYESLAKKVADKPAPTTHYRSARAELVKELLVACARAGKCPTCGTSRSRIRKSGHTKLFRSKPRKSRGGPKDSQFVASDDEEDEVDIKKGAGDVHEDDSEELYIPPTEAEDQLKRLWRFEDKKVSRDFFGPDPSVFFIRDLFVPPSRFRPARRTGSGIVVENDQTKLFGNVLQAHELLVNRFLQQQKEEEESSAEDDEDDNASEEERKKNMGTTMYDWINLQNNVNVLIDENKSDRMSKANASDQLRGIRQIFEKKEGLFRQNLMGKRVNFAARSVISPDPMIGTDEVGVPLKFAKKLTFPEPVAAFNCEYLAQCVRNGPDVHPGAVYIEDSAGRLIDLRHRTQRQRLDLANKIEELPFKPEFKEERFLQTRKEAFRKGDNAQEASNFTRIRSEARAHAHTLGTQTKVWRHLRNGDALLANRQPTLHKASIMAHRARVINNPKMETIRLHYANCYTYNADFDGDEINLHFPQTELARAEAYEIAYTNHQYCAPTDGVPMRGLIQDHLAMGVLLTKKSTFFSRDEFVQNVFSATPDIKTPLDLPPPAVLTREKQLWTGKQLLSAVLKRVVPGSERLVLVNSKPKTPNTAFQRKKEVPAGDAWSFEGLLSDTRVYVYQGELVSGVLDKNAFGNSSKYGFVHSVFECFGAQAAGDLLSALGRLFVQLERTWGHTCGMDDLMLVPEAERVRTKQIAEGELKGVKLSNAFALGLLDGGKKYDVDKDTADLDKNEAGLALERRVAGSSNPRLEEQLLDGAMGGVTSKVQSEIMKTCVPFGQAKRFPENNFALMVLTGAKGSNVNQTQISCLLGQQSLEGRRVPRMSSGKTLPCFDAFDPSPRAGGFVTNRFLSGIRVQEYYFHCMAGREGLLDTAVKTARSGYLQRCMVKHLEHLKVAYDGTVRADDGSVVQFSYGEGDGLDALNVPYLMGTDDCFKFLLDNRASFVPSAGYEPENPEEPTSVLPGALRDKLEDFIRRDPHKDFAKMKSKQADKVQAELRRVVAFKYTKSLVAGGEAVGVLAAQGVGEPSTQMTLNTFHLAGHAEKNVTLGIPRLRELLWARSPGKTPTLRMPCTSKADAEHVANRLTRVPLSDLLLCEGGAVRVREVMVRKSPRTLEASGVDAVKALKQDGAGTGSWYRRYFIQYRLFPLDVLKEEFGFGMDRIADAVSKRVVNKLCVAINKELKRMSGGVAVQAAKVSTARRARSDEDGEEDEADMGFDASEDAPKGDEEAMGDDDEEQEDSEPDDDEDDGSNKKKQKSKTSGKGDYDDDEEEDEEDEDEEVGVPAGKEDADDEDQALEAEAAMDYEDEEDDDKAVKAKKKDAKKQKLEKNDAKLSSGKKNGSATDGETKKVPCECNAQCLLGVTSCSNKASPYVEIALEFPADVKRLLLVDLVEGLAHECAVRAVEGILSARPDEDQGKFFVDVMGESSNKFDMKTMFRFQHLGDVSKLDCNDVNAVLRTLGVEAARACLIKQFKAVFDPYGIDIDERHLGLAADHMLFEGHFRGMNRKGIDFSTSPLVRMTFETAVKFIIDAALEGEKDALDTPAARIATGQVIRTGTGSFGVLVGAVKERH